MSNSKRPNAPFSLIVWLLPASRVKNWLLNRLGNHISSSAYLAPNFVWECGAFEIDDFGRIGTFNVFKRLRSVRLGEKSVIGTFNHFTAVPEYQVHHDDAGTLTMKEMTFITNRHYFSCSGRVILEQRSAIGGVHSLIQTHELDIVNNVATVGTIRLGEQSIVTANCVLLKGAELPPRSILAAGSLLARAKGDGSAEEGLWAGRPARKIRELPECKWWYRDDYFTPVTPYIDI